MSIFSDIGTKVGDKLKTLDIRLTSAETAIVNLGGQEPPPTGSFTIEPVTWTNLTEINLSGEKLTNEDFSAVTNGVPDGWTVTSGTLDQAELALGNIDGGSGKVVIEQTFPTPIPAGTKLVAKIERSEPSTGNIRFRAIWNSGETNHDVNPSVGHVDIEVPVGKTLVGVRIDTLASPRAISSASIFQGEVAGGSVQTFTGGSIEKISGAGAYNAGASSVQKIDGQKDGYVQFQISHGTHSLKIGLVNQDHDFEVDAPWKMNFGGGHIDLSAPWIADHTPFVAGDWFRIRHYSQDNEIHFQKRQTVYGELPNFALPTSPNNGHPHHHTFDEEDRPLVVSLETQTVNGVELTEGKAFKIKKYNVSTESVDLVQLDGTDIGWGSGARASKWEVAEELGEDYVTFYTHPTLSNGADLYVDTIFHAVGARLNDVQIAYK